MPAHPTPPHATPPSTTPHQTPTQSCQATLKGSPWEVTGKGKVPGRCLSFSVKLFLIYPPFPPRSNKASQYLSTTAILVS